MFDEIQKLNFAVLLSGNFPDGMLDSRVAQLMDSCRPCLGSLGLLLSFVGFTCFF